MAKVKKKNKRSKLLILIIGLAGLLLVVGGVIYRLRLADYFTKLSDKEIVKEKEVAIEDKGEEVTIEESEGLPENFPADFPIYPDAQIENAFTSKGEEIEAQSVIWMVQDSFKKVSEFYSTNLEKRGWKIDSTFESEDSVTFSIAKGAVQGFVGIGKGEDEFVVISVTIGARFEEPTI